MSRKSTITTRIVRSQICDVDLTTGTAGSLYKLLVLNPATSAFAEVANIVNCFARYKVNSCTVRFNPQWANTGGVVTLGYFEDVYDGTAWYSGSHPFGALYTLPHKTVQLSRPTVLRCTPGDKSRWRTVSTASATESCFGAVAVTAELTSASMKVGNLEITFDISLEGMNPQQFGPSLGLIKADDQDAALDDVPMDLDIPSTAET